MSFWRKMFGPVRLALLSQLEYRFNLFVDALVQPVLTCVVEVTLWWVIFQSLQTKTFGGYGLENYLIYSLWAVFFARIAANWMYEFKMIDEIDSGRVNSLIVRPMPFYQFYLGQYLGYKFLTSSLSLILPIAISFVYQDAIDLSRLPLALLLAALFVLFTHTLSFLVASLSFFFNRVHSITMMKNIIISIISGELFPLDLVPAAIRPFAMYSPFACGVYLPVGYMTGRVTLEQLMIGFISLTVSFAVLGVLTHLVWNRGLKAYAGSGA